jgi:lipid II isoglutaminyl synthase (glutamine-hydrolysing)
VIEIAWIFPRHLSTYGDGGNILALEYRCRARGIPCRVHPVMPGGALPRASIIFIGGGQDRCQVAAAPAIGRLRDPIRAAVQDGCVVLGVCAGYQFLGRRYQLPDGGQVAGLGLLDLETAAGEGRFVGRVVVRPDPALEVRAGIVGFENHSGRTVLGRDPDLRPLGRVVRGHGNNGADGLEGAFKGAVFGTYLHGPVLPNNPELCDRLIRLALGRDGRCEELTPLDDAVERAAAAAFLR